MVRRAGVADARALADIHVSSWQATYRGVLDDTFLDNLDRVARQRWFALQIERGVSVLVSPDDEPAGLAWFGEAREEGWGEVFAIYVHPDQWGQGHGRLLMERAQQEMRDLGFERGLLWVLDSNKRARRFYEKQGWTLSSRVKLEEMGGTQVTEVRYEVDLSESL